MKFIVSKFSCLILMLFLMVNSAGAAAIGDGVIIISPVATTTYSEGDERDDEALLGMTGVIVGDLNEAGLYPVRMDYNYMTWIAPKDLLIDSSLTKEWKNGVTHQVVAPKVDVLGAPDVTAFPPLISLSRGAYVQVRDSGEVGKYVSVLLPDGREGYVHQNLLRPIRVWNEMGEGATRKNLVADALSYLGTSYRWGGKTPEGIDCSGFASMVYMLNGLNIYRNASPNAGYPIALLDVKGTEDDEYTLASLSKARPGDMIYWEGHQGIYIGGGKYIHANASSFDTRINSLIKEDPDYREDLAAPSAVYAWGTAFPKRPDQIVVCQFKAVNAYENQYYFYGKIEGYAPNRGILYPEGKGEGKPQIEIKDPSYMLYDSPTSTAPQIPVYGYTKPGIYYPVIELINDAGWGSEKSVIRVEAMMKSPVVISN